MNQKLQDGAKRLDQAEVVLRPARSDEAERGARLILHSFHSPALVQYLFGLGDMRRAERAFAKLFAKRANRFSHQFATFAEVGGKPVGILLGYSARTLRWLNFRTAFQLPAVYGFTGALRFIHRVHDAFWGIPDPDRREWFIDNLAVLPGWRNRGIGSRLLAAAEAQTCRLCLKACSLDVEVENGAARRLYERMGFRRVATFRLGRLHRLCGFSGVHRMVRERV